MKVSECMTEIRRIKNENSLRHITMTKEERRKESEQALAWLSEKINKPLKIISTPEKLN